MLIVRSLFAALLLAIAAAAALAGEKGFFGLSLSVELAGPATSPILRELKVVKVLTESPAAKAGIERGDLIVEVEGKRVSGANALEFSSLMQREVGEPLRLLIQRGKAEPFSVTLIAVVGRPE